VTKRILKRVARELDAGNPSWRVIVLGDSWLCPFCGEIGAASLRMEESLEDRIAEHLETCEAYGETSVPLDKPALDKRAALITWKDRVRRSLGDPVFHVADGERAWICPFCARPTSIAFPHDHEAAAEDDRLATQLVRHLLECPDFAGGKGKPRLLAEVMQAATRSDRKKRAKRIQARLRADPVFRFRDMDKGWLCPFCASPTDIPFDRDAEPPPELCEQVMDHLDGCADYARLEGKPRGERYLKDRVIAVNRAKVLERLKRKLAGHAIWQVTDADDRWYCPYCAKPTGVTWIDPRSSGISDAALNEVWAHLSSCPAYAGKRAQLKTKSFLRNIVAEQDRKIRLRREVRRALAEDARFSIHDATGSWLCPHCRKVQKQIVVTRESASLVEKTVEQVVTHLLEECPRYQEGAEPGASAEELLLDVAGAKPGRARRASADSEEWIRRIDQEVQALETKVQVSEELARSLEDARSRQLRLLPRAPEIPGFEIGIVYKPSSTVGGDFYDFIRVRDDLLGIAVGDIAGHGIEAALLVGLAKKLLEIHGRARTSAAETLLLANADIYPDLDAKTFVTVFYGLLNTKTRELRFSRAGHNPLILFNPRRSPRLTVLDSKGMALGMDPGPIFQHSLEEVAITLAPGDLVFQYTDGVPESMNHDKEEFGLERMYAVLEQHGEAEAEYLLYQMEKALADFREGAKQKDDITMVALRVL
jgi:serine phosphatase RsbU (regulator of sigma subunit)/rubredoxin